MFDLLNSYSLENILIFIVVLGLAIKGVVDFWDWMVVRLRQAFKKENEEEKTQVKTQYRFDAHDATLQQLGQKQEELQQQITEISDQVSLLLHSDMDDIKSYITEKHHYFCYEQGWIDDYSLDCIEQRYSHYVDEGGNSFIHTFMKEIRSLPKIPPEKKGE